MRCTDPVAAAGAFGHACDVEASSKGRRQRQLQLSFFSEAALFALGRIDTVACGRQAPALCFFW